MTTPFTILITGANRGIGRGFVQFYLARPSATVIAAVRNPSHPTSKTLEELPKGNGSKLVVVKLDSSVPSDAAKAIATIKNEHNICSLDIVIANAAIAKNGCRIRDTSVEDINEHIQTNAATLDLLKTGKTGSPIFVAISSIAGSINSMEFLADVPGFFSPYGASKTALNWFIRNLHFEEPWLISFVIHPGAVETDVAIANMKEHGGNLSDYGFITVETSVAFMAKIIDKATKKIGGTFQTYDGTILAW
ncbi:hypothetical protein LB504_008951 [Fusarium proliferatum]|nr:hypothetical protein LB504_008951 [Fusarium proliferatum]